MPPAEFHVVRDADQAAALLAPLRMQILNTLREPGSATGVARQLGLPRQKVNYHLRELEQHRLLHFVEEQRKGNCMERIVQATARSYVISPEALGKLSDGVTPSSDRFSAAYLVSAAARVIRDLAVLGSRALSARKQIATLTIETEVRFASAGERAAFADELSRSVAALAAKYHHSTAPAGRTFRFVVAGLPKITKEGAEESADAIFHA
jgi:DNA-binding transcriptional ArsR family regulator